MKIPNRTRPAARPRLSPRRPARPFRRSWLLAAIVFPVAFAPSSGPRADELPVPEAIPALDAWVVVPGFGDFRIRFDREQSPNHVAHFLALAGSGFYDGLSFHRIVPRLLVQAGAAATREGAPREWTIVPPDYRVTAEAAAPSTPIQRGTVCMALQNGESGSAGTEWFVALTDGAKLSGLGVPIGTVTEGLGTLDKLEQASTWVNRRPLERIPFEIRLGPVDQPEGAGAPALDQPAATDGEPGSGDAEAGS